MTNNLRITLFCITCLTISILSIPIYSQDAPVETQSIANYLDSLDHISISPDGNSIAINGCKYRPHIHNPNAVQSTARIMVMNLRDAGLKKVFDAYDEEAVTVPRSIQYSPNGYQILAGFEPGFAYVFNALSGEIIHNVTSDEPYRPCGTVGVTGLMFTSDGSRFVTGLTCTARLNPNRAWNSETGDLDIALTQAIQENPNLHSIIACSNNDIVISRMYDYSSTQSVEHILLYDLKKRNVVNEFPGHWPVVSRNLRYVAYFNNEKNAVEAMDLKTFKVITHAAVTYDSSNSHPLAVSDRGVLAMSGKKTYARKLIAPDPMGVVYEYPIAKSDNEADNNITFFPEGDRFLTVNGTDINIWDISKISTGVKDAGKF